MALAVLLLIPSFTLLFDKFNIDNGGSLFRMTSANMTANYSFSSQGKKDTKKKNVQGAKNGGRDDDLFGFSA